MLLLILLWGFTKNLIFYRGGGGTRTKSGQWGWTGGLGWSLGSWTVFRFKGKGALVKKEEMFSLPHFGKEGTCHDRKNFRKWLHLCKNSTKTFIKRMTSDWGSYETRKYLKKTQIGCRRMLVASQLSRNNFLVIVVKINTEADFKVSCYCPILLDFVTYFQIFCQDGRCLLFLGIHCKYE